VNYLPIEVSGNIRSLQVTSAVAGNKLNVPKHLTEEQVQRSSVGVTYTCLAIGIGASNTDDAKFLVAKIAGLNTKFESLRRQHDDFMKLRAHASTGLKSSGLAHPFYEKCNGPILNMKQCRCPETSISCSGKYRLSFKILLELIIQTKHMQLCTTHISACQKASLLC
jgi:hypothetical protein